MKTMVQRDKFKEQNLIFKGYFGFNTFNTAFKNLSKVKNYHSKSVNDITPKQLMNYY